MIDYTLLLDRLPDPLPIEPLTKPFDVTITPPGSKSITCRAYILAALAEGESQIIRPLRADDTDALLDALCTLGAEARWEGDSVHINGVGGRFPRGGHVNLGDGGAPTRFMIAAACLAAEPVIVDGSPRMRQRPIAEGVNMLRQLGAKIEYVAQEGRLPVRVVPSGPFKGGKLMVGKTQSSQFISALLLIGPWLPAGIHARNLGPITSRKYVVMTSRVILDCAGQAICESARSEKDLADWRVGIHGDGVRGFEYRVEPDASSAVPWFVAASMTRLARMRVAGLGGNSPQPDVLVLTALHNAGVHIDHHPEEFLGVEGPNELRSFGVDAENMPDGAVFLVTMSAMSNGVSRLTGLHTLRHKETNRIAALANELRKIGCAVETTDDSITIDPSTRHDKPVVIETYNDHRMAMAFAVLGLARPGISIKNPACVSKSYPTFWKDFAKLYQ